MLGQSFMFCSMRVLKLEPWILKVLVSPSRNHKLPEFGFPLALGPQRLSFLSCKSTYVIIYYFIYKNTGKSRLENTCSGFPLVNFSFNCFFLNTFLWVLKQMSLTSRITKTTFSHVFDQPKILLFISLFWPSKSYLTFKCHLRFSFSSNIFHDDNNYKTTMTLSSVILC
jgi:hypothetical protein